MALNRADKRKLIFIAFIVIPTIFVCFLLLSKSQNSNFAVSEVQLREENVISQRNDNYHASDYQKTTPVVNELTRYNCEQMMNEQRLDEEVETFVFFFGFNHCGSTATGMIIDSHPHAISANEYDLFGEMQNGTSLKQATVKICKVAVQNQLDYSRRKGYSTKMGKFHGKFVQPLQVIGPRKSFVTSKRYLENESTFRLAFNQIASRWEAVGVMVVRNIYDMIATRAAIEFHEVDIQYTFPNGTKFLFNRVNYNRVGKPVLKKEYYNLCHFGLSDGSVKVISKPAIFESIETFRKHAEGSRKMINDLQFRYLIMPLDRLIKYPRVQIQKICAFLRLDCDEEFVSTAAAGVLSESNPTRHGVDWTDDIMEKVNELIAEYPDFFPTDV